MYITKEQTLLDTILNNELQKFKNYLLKENVQYDTLTFKDKWMFTYETPMVLVHNTLNLLKTQGVVADNPSLLNGNYLLKTTTKQIIHINTLISFTHALKLIEKAMKTPTFYGALLKLGNNIYNILHPLVALAIKEKNNAIFQTDTKFKLILYFYEDKNLTSLYYEDYKTTRKACLTNIATILKIAKEPFKEHKKSMYEIVTVEPIPNTKTSFQKILGIASEKLEVQQYDIDKIPIFVSHQLLTNGIITPYYGTSQINFSREKNATAYHISPMLSANIVRPSYNTSTLSSSSVCTGKQPSTTLDGISVLNHSYLGSPYNSDCISSGAILYADTCIEVSTGIYKEMGLITTQYKAKDYNLPELYEKILSTLTDSPTEIAQLVKDYSENPDTQTKLLQALKRYKEYHADKNN